MEVAVGASAPAIMVLAADQDVKTEVYTYRVISLCIIQTISIYYVNINDYKCNVITSYYIKLITNYILLNLYKPSILGMNPLTDSAHVPFLLCTSLRW